MDRPHHVGIVSRNSRVREHFSACCLYSIIEVALGLHNHGLQVVPAFGLNHGAQKLEQANPIRRRLCIHISLQYWPGRPGVQGHLHVLLLSVYKVGVAHLSFAEEAEGS